QAEDGIRDFHVTGVQTCALPIFPATDPCGHFGLGIARDGTWYYHGSPIGRKAIAKLFARVLRREDDGSYWLVTPAERGRIDVEEIGRASCRERGEIYGAVGTLQR